MCLVQEQEKNEFGVSVPMKTRGNYAQKFQVSHSSVLNLHDTSTSVISWMIGFVSQKSFYLWLHSVNPSRSLFMLHSCDTVTFD